MIQQGYQIDGKWFDDESNVKFPKPIAEILQQIREEYDSGIEFSRDKRELFEKRHKLYANISDTENKVYIRLLFSVMQTLMSLYYSDTPTVKFYGRTLGDEDLANNINNVRGFDYEEMDLEKKKYTVQWDRLFYGCGIEIFEDWDDDIQCPVSRVMNPMTRIPDPYSYLGGDERFHGFELEIDLDMLTEENGFKNKDLLIGKTLEDLTKTARESVGDVRQLSVEDYEKIRKTTIYYHYTIINNKKYFICTDYSKSIIIKFEEIQPANKAQKRNPSLVKFPVIIRHWSPLQGDPYGVCIPDIMEDKQMMIQLFTNLNRIKAEHEAWGDMFFYDEDAIKDISALQIPTQGPKYIKANLRQNPNPIMEVPRNSVKPDAYNMPQILQQQASLDLGMDQRTLGIQGGSNITATENQTIQKNANLRMMLGSKIDGWAEKEFAKIWYSFYQLNFKGGEKAFRLGSAIGSNYFSLKRNQFITDSDIDVEILTQSQVNDREEKEKVGLMAMLNDLINNPLSSNFSKTFTRRRILKLTGVPEDIIMAMLPKTKEELQADMDVDLINNGEDIIPITDMNEDHRTYLVKYDRAIDNEQKFRAIEARKKALTASGQSQINPQQQGGNMQMQGQLVNQMMQQQNSTQGKAASLQNVAQ